MGVSVNTIDDAALNLSEVVKVTPLIYNSRLSKKYKADIYLKREDLQDVRSFKIRGAYNKMSKLSKEDRKKGIVCASAGNHAQGVSFSCAKLKIKGTIFMPTTTPNQKVTKVRNFGGKYVDIKLIGNTFDEAFYASQKFCEAEKAIFVHPFNDEDVISGQGTVGKEIYEKLEGNLDYVVATIGGGGLISGVSTYLKGKDQNIKVIGCEPLGAAAMYESLKKGKIIKLEKIDTFVDGAAVSQVGDITYKICKKNVDKVFTVPEGKVCTTMIELYQNEGIVSEPAGALAISALDEIATFIEGKTVVCVLSGGNNDLLRYPEILERSLVYEGLKHYFIINFAQKPGQLRRFVNNVMGPNDDIARFEYIKKTNAEQGPALVGVILSKKEDYEFFIERLKATGFSYEVITNGNILFKYLV